MLIAASDLDDDSFESLHNLNVPPPSMPCFPEFVLTFSAICFCSSSMLVVVCCNAPVTVPTEMFVTFILPLALVGGNINKAALLFLITATRTSGYNMYVHSRPEAHPDMASTFLTADRTTVPWPSSIAILPGRSQSQHHFNHFTYNKSHNENQGRSEQLAYSKQRPVMGSYRYIYSLCSSPSTSTRHRY